MRKSETKKSEEYAIPVGTRYGSISAVLKAAGIEEASLPNQIKFSHHGNGFNYRTKQGERLFFDGITVAVPSHGRDKYFHRKTTLRKSETAESGYAFRLDEVRKKVKDALTEYADRRKLREEKEIRQQAYNDLIDEAKAPFAAVPVSYRAKMTEGPAVRRLSALVPEGLEKKAENVFFEITITGLSAVHMRAALEALGFLSKEAERHRGESETP